MRLEGHTALVTAAGQGIGRAIAEAFLREGATVFATDRDVGLLDSFDGEARELDVTSTTAVDALCAEVGSVSILANVAGTVHHGSVLDATESEWDQAFDLNAKAMHRAIRACLPGMLQQGRGSIVNMASAVSSLKGAPNRYVYGASKAAVIGLTKSVAADFVTQGIRCNAICPGTVRSPSWEQRAEELGKSVGGTDKAVEMFVARQPMGRLGTADEIAALAVYLAADESAFTTGQAIAVDGGWTI